MKDVPINFVLDSEDDIGYITTESNLSDSLGFASCTFHVNPADLVNLNRSETTINVDINVGDFFSDTVTKTYLIEGNPNVEYEVAELWPSSGNVPINGNFNFYVDYDPVNQNFEDQYRDLCFKTKDDEESPPFK